MGWRKGWWDETQGGRKLRRKGARERGKLGS